MTESMPTGLTPVRLRAQTVAPREESAVRGTWPVFGHAEVAAAVEVLGSGAVNYWTGTQGRRFEEEFAAAVGCEYGVAVANGTMALEIALRVLGVGPGDEVIVPSRTFIASASCVVALGARPVVVDVDPDSQNLTAQTVLAGITARTKAVVAVHLAGWPVEMAGLLELAREYGIAVVEDCAQAHGARLHGRPVGSWGDVAAWSFCQDKILTTAGEGGMITTNDPALHQAAWSYKDHGKSWKKAHQPATGTGYRWVHDSFGTNARMHEIAAAVGRAALPRLPADLAARRRNAAVLTARLAGLPVLRTTTPPPWVEHAYYRWYGFIRPERLRDGWDRGRILATLVAAGVPCSVGSCGEVYREAAFPAAWRPAHALPTAAELARTSLAFLVHPTLESADMHHWADLITHVLSEASIGRLEPPYLPE
ncbi:dTDP-4-amino-4,6-dideoxygalactose transaminase [Parafrankia irregularis]|uniref:dTDP-4-amino-4,6-dideoxygalactose transaminase n=1 Tax=Parafrankia irregularis TaxID=795642 RepID=A0A0S4QDS1_9ACTN|nr:MULTISPECIES: DegT/DnrJ/EryC1/StrS aminotransferase family protein [Parafrankia]MBE3199543.1 DegT/DnrJ/EryC1/StrS aminotransferase family protein [Parafrankia sp. CH37]CUU53792.1 dTDP-4-amino-4,6-dideoxygalactose transaminase [Parafrankia irregularis]